MPPTDIVSDTHSDIASCIQFSDILSGSLSFRHVCCLAFHLAFYLALSLAFYLIYILTFYLAIRLTSILTHSDILSRTLCGSLHLSDICRSLLKPTEIGHSQFEVRQCPLLSAARRGGRGEGGGGGWDAPLIHLIKI